MVIEHLAERPELVRILAAWFVEEWASYYGPGGPGDAVADLHAACNRDAVPLALVARDCGRILGTAAIREGSVASHRHLGPWLTGLLVRHQERRRGVGSALVAAIEREARRLGFPALYTATETGVGIVEARGWSLVDTAPTADGPVRVWRIGLGE